jgi:hypothetical protein
MFASSTAGLNDVNQEDEMDVVGNLLGSRMYG